MELETELKEAKRKIKELGGVKVDVRKTAKIHLPIKYNKIVDRPIVVKNFNQTMECYEDPSMGVRSAHVTVKCKVHLDFITYRIHISHFNLYQRTKSISNWMPVLQQNCPQART